MSYILTYGSLREGQYNAKAFKEEFGDGYQYIGTLDITGYKLYSLGSYPAIKETKNIEDTLTVDIFKVSDEVQSEIDNMEHGAGYDSHKRIVRFNDKTYPCTIYVYGYSLDEKYLVKSGDWSKFKQEQKQQLV
jgi:gamma-glutamylcyclotransferase (GGCT)/AIG2-like uncharacterized protein YtfP